MGIEAADGRVPPCLQPLAGGEAVEQLEKGLRHRLRTMQKCARGTKPGRSLVSLPSARRPQTQQKWMSSAAAHRVPVRAKRIGARPRLDQLELRKPCPYLVGRNALRKKPATPLSGPPPERVQQVGRTGPRHPGDLARVSRLCRLRQGVEASLIKEKVEARIDRILVEPRNVAHEEHD